MGAILIPENILHTLRMNHMQAICPRAQIFIVFLTYHTMLATDGAPPSSGINSGQLQTSYEEMASSILGTA
jgi:hypothetical protein